MSEDDPYVDGNIPPWDIGKPQPRFVKACEEGYIKGKILDIACGTGENTLYYASKGHETWGIDQAKTGIKRAMKKSKDRGLEENVTFKVGDAFNLEALGQRFDTITDSGFLHGRDDKKKEKVVETVNSVLKSGGKYIILGFHEDEPLERGPPNRLKQKNFDNLFNDSIGMKVEVLEEAEFHSNLPQTPHKAYFSVVKKF